MVFFTKFCSSDLRVRAGSQEGSDHQLEALTFLAARVAGDGGDARKALQVGGPLRMNQWGEDSQQGFFGNRMGAGNRGICVWYAMYTVYVYMCIVYIHTYIYVYIL